MHIASKIKYLCLVLLLFFVAVGAYFFLKKESYDTILNREYKEMIQLPSNISIEELEEKGYINLNRKDGEVIRQWKNAMNRYYEAVYREEAYGFYYFKYPKLFFVIHNPEAKVVALSEYDVVEGYMQDPDLIFSKLEKIETDGKVRYVLKTKKVDSIIQNYAAEDREIYSHAK